MGVSTNAIIFYGILLDKDDCECEFNDIKEFKLAMRIIGK